MERMEVHRFGSQLQVSAARARHCSGKTCHFSSSSSFYCAGQRLTPHYRTLEVRPGRITKKLELKYDYDCERDDTNSLLGNWVC